MAQYTIEITGTITVNTDTPIEAHRQAHKLISDIDTKAQLNLEVDSRTANLVRKPNATLGSCIQKYFADIKE